MSSFLDIHLLRGDRRNKLYKLGVVIWIHLLQYMGTTNCAATAARFVKDPPMDSRIVMWNATLTYACPDASIDDSNSTKLYFFHDTLQRCLQSGFDSVLVVDGVPKNFGGTVECRVGSCVVGTNIIHESSELHGRLDLTVDYPPTYINMNQDIKPDSVLTCPFEAKPAATFTFKQCESGPYACDDVCHTCNASCPRDPHQTDDPIDLQEMCESMDPCYYHRTNQSEVVLLPYCYGCVMCTATNTINGVNHTQSHKWLIDTRKQATQCSAYIRDVDITVSPGDTFVPGRDHLKITVNAHVSASFQASVQCNGSEFRPEDHNAKLVTSTGDDCMQTIELIWESAGTTDTGLYQITIGTIEDFATVNATIIATPEKTVNCDPEYCHRHGACQQLVGTGEKYCQCDALSHQQTHGKQCQYSCTPASSQETRGHIDLCVGCDFSTTGFCLGTTPEDDGHVTWEHNGIAYADKGSYMPINIVDATPADTVNYSCFLFGQLLHTIFIQVNTAPFLKKDASTTQQTPRNASARYPVAIPLDPRVYPEVHYKWVAVNTYQSELTDKDRMSCIVSSVSPSLSLKQQDRCQGWYKGTATNDYGSVDYFFQADTRGPNPPAALGKKIAEIAGAAVGAAVGAAALTILLVKCILKKKQRPPKPFEAQKEWGERERAGLLANEDANSESDGDLPVLGSRPNRPRHDVRELINPSSVSTPPPPSPASAGVSDDQQLPTPIVSRHRGRADRSQAGPVYGASVSSAEYTYQDTDTTRSESTPLRPGQPRSSFGTDLSADEMWKVTPGNSLLLEATTDESRYCNDEVRHVLKPELESQPRGQFVNEFRIPLVRMLSLRTEELAQESQDCLSHGLLVSLRERKQAAVQGFIDFWAGAEQKTFWDLFNAVCTVLTPDQNDFVRKLRDHAERMLRSEYYRHGVPAARKADLSTISQAFSQEQQQSTPPFMSRPSKLGSLASPLAKDGDDDKTAPFT
ncbi:uncharacterized protein LOC135822225 [Sycon ciliatum]|uniref:uncharacterized protein LOC135822225 n=1 Tax=Sycon ciliatum TaxID=27933 RepID=UPI0031F71F41